MEKLQPDAVAFQGTATTMIVLEFMSNHSSCAFALRFCLTSTVMHLMHTIMSGPTKLEAVRWVGNENGHAAEPNWIASDDAMANGPGHPNGSVVAPAEVDTPFATVS